MRKPRYRASVPVGGLYQWYKIVGPKQQYASYLQYYIMVAEIEINGTTPTEAYGSSEYTAGEYATGHVIDGDLGTYWGTVMDSTPSESWLAVKMASSVLVSKLGLYPRGSSNQELCFSGFALYGSNDSTNGSDGTWTLIDSGLTRTDDLIRWHEWTF